MNMRHIYNTTAFYTWGMVFASLNKRRNGTGIINNTYMCIHLCFVTNPSFIALQLQFPLQFKFTLNHSFTHSSSLQLQYKAPNWISINFHRIRKVVHVGVDTNFQWNGLILLTQQKTRHSNQTVKNAIYAPPLTTLLYKVPRANLSSAEQRAFTYTPVQRPGTVSPHHCHMLFLLLFVYCSQLFIDAFIHLNACFFVSLY